MTKRKKTDGNLVPYEVPTDDMGREAFKLRQRGESWELIAREVGFSSPGSAQVSASKYRQSLRIHISDERKEEDLDMELSRLNTLQAAIWDNALSGDLQAIDRILKIIQTRAKLVGLDVQQERSTTNNTIVVTGDSGQFVERLKMIAGEVDG